MAHPRGDPVFERKPPELPDVRGGRAPVGYEPGFNLGERLQGCLLVLVGLLGMAGLYVIFSLGGLPGTPSPPPAPPGLGGMTVPPILSATTCLVPGVAIGSLALILVGLRRIVDPW